MEASYKLHEFIQNCAIGVTNVIILKGAMETARTDLNLKTQQQVLGFIGNGGLEHPHFINTKPWENNLDATCIMVDAYGFYSGFYLWILSIYLSTQN